MVSYGWILIRLREKWIQGSYKKTAEVPQDMYLHWRIVLTHQTQGPTMLDPGGGYRRRRNPEQVRVE